MPMSNSEARKREERRKAAERGPLFFVEHDAEGDVHVVWRRVDDARRCVVALSRVNVYDDELWEFIVTAISDVAVDEAFRQGRAAEVHG